MRDRRFTLITSRSDKNRLQTFYFGLPLSLLLSLLIATGASAEVYKHVDEKGKVTFSDQPSPEATPVEIKELNTLKPLPAKAPKPASPRPEQAPDYKITITSPADNSVVANGLVGLTVTSSLSPALKSGYQLQLSVDGKPHSKNASGQFQLATVQRGRHSLQVSLLDEAGEVLAKSAAVSITVYRPN